MKKRPRLLLALALVFLVLVIWQVVSAGKRDGSKLRVSIPEVGTLYFERAEYGTNFVYGSATERFIHGLLGEKRMRQMGMTQAIVVNRSAPVLWVWLTLDQPESKMPKNPNFSLADENGFFAGRIYGGHVKPYGPNAMSIGVAFERIPRASRILKLRMLLPDEHWEYRHRAEFSFANPLRPATYPAFTTNPLPLTRSTNGLDITLQRLAFGVGSGRKFTPAATNQTSESLASFVIRKGGKAVKDWRPADVWLKDRYGNETRSGAHGNSRRGTTNFYQFSPGLWPDTNGLQFKFEFSREKEAQFLTNELIALHGIQVPVGTNVTELNLTTNILGHDITVVGLFGERGKLAGHRRSKSSGISLEVKADPPLLDKRLDLIRVVDNEGRDGRESGKSWSRPSGRYGIGIKIHNTAKEVDLTLAVHPSVFFEFTVAPEILKP